MTGINGAIESILKQAIKIEEDSYNLYTNARKMVKLEHTRSWLDELAGYELEHKAKLEGLLVGDVERAIKESQREKVINLKIGDYLVAQPLDADSDFQDVLLVAIKREQATHDLYANMADLVEAGTIKSLFELLAQEELRHKNKVETFYEEMIYQDF